MHAAMVEDFRFPPRYRETAPPVANEGEIVLRVRAAALTEPGARPGERFTLQQCHKTSLYSWDTMAWAWMQRARVSTSFRPASLLAPWLKPAWFRDP